MKENTFYTYIYLIYDQLHKRKQNAISVFNTFSQSSHDFGL